ncbi:sigma 54-interacting transcriptional regulator [Planococcus sp. ISL-110]|uniref:sigma 54-interacting transcriptional regulator n=1 Tax=Planococcus sp. ISL-110 TaxID=2819167 RepID=UPI001BEBD140|nr:sigma 54-interacting transcriptional regulator [Planococcus sp. ISL-110]MBT2569609.1 sigma 54-interacting transcriptional regulator [Planococcus sp. ISL-110]
MNTLFLLPNTDEEIIDAYDEDIIVTTREGRIIKVSPHSGEPYGVAPEELLGKSVYDLEAAGIFSPAITPLVLEQKKKVVLRQDTPSGRKVLITGIPLFNDKGNVDFVVSYSYDMSQLMVMKEYLENLESEMSKVKSELAHLRKQQLHVEGCVMESPSSSRALQTAIKMAQLQTPVVIQGEPGTGKTALAKFIHSQSSRRDAAFIEVHCSAIPESVFEISFTGLDGEGYMGLAAGGTLVLNEIDQLSPASQAALFNILQQPHTARIIAISNASVEKAVSDGRFRQDLFYSLHLASIELKPLRERPDDLDQSISLFLEELNNNYQQQKSLSDDLYFHLLQLPWKSNFRELRNVLERSFIESDSALVTLDDLPITYQPDSDERIGFELDGQTLPHILEAVEKKVLLNAQKRYRTTTEMANILGISQPSVVRKLKKYTNTPSGGEIT